MSPALSPPRPFFSFSLCREQGLPTGSQGHHYLCGATVHAQRVSLQMRLSDGCTVTSGTTTRLILSSLTAQPRLHPESYSVGPSDSMLEGSPPRSLLAARSRQHCSPMSRPPRRARHLVDSRPICRSANIVLVLLGYGWYPHWRVLLIPMVPIAPVQRQKNHQRNPSLCLAQNHRTATTHRFTTYHSLVSACTMTDMPHSMTHQTMRSVLECGPYGVVAYTPAKSRTPS